VRRLDTALDSGKIYKATVGRNQTARPAPIQSAAEPAHSRLLPQSNGALPERPVFIDNWLNRLPCGFDRKVW